MGKMTQPQTYGEGPGLTSVATSCCSFRHIYQTIKMTQFNISKICSEEKEIE